MSGLTDIVSSVSSLGNEPSRNIFFLRCPIVFFTEFQIFKIGGSILCYGKSDSINYTAIQRIVPFLFDSNVIGIQRHVLDETFVILSCYISSIRNRYCSTGLCCPVIGSRNLVSVRFQSICAGSCFGRGCEFYNLSLLGIGKGSISLQAIVQVSNQVVCSLARPYNEFNLICNTVRKLEGLSHIPMDCPICGVIRRCCAAIRFSSSPFSPDTINSTIVFKTVRVNSLHDLHLSIGQCGDAVSDLHIAKAKGRLDGFGYISKGFFQRIGICCKIGSAAACFVYKVLYLGNICRNADSIESLVVSKY